MTIFIIILSLCLNPLWVPIALRVRCGEVSKARNASFHPPKDLIFTAVHVTLQPLGSCDVPSVSGQDVCPGFLLPGIHSLSHSPNPMPTERNQLLVLSFCKRSQKASPSVHDQAPQQHTVRPTVLFFQFHCLLMTLIMIN